MPGSRLVTAVNGADPFGIRIDAGWFGPRGSGSHKPDSQVDTVDGLTLAEDLCPILIVECQAAL